MEKIKEEEAYKAVEKNLSGSRPRELFDDVVEDAEKEFEKDRTVLKVRPITETQKCWLARYTSVRLLMEVRALCAREPRVPVDAAAAAAAAGKTPLQLDCFWRLTHCAHRAGAGEESQHRGRAGDGLRGIFGCGGRHRQPARSRDLGHTQVRSLPGTYAMTWGPAVFNSGLQSHRCMIRVYSKRIKHR